MTAVRPPPSPDPAPERTPPRRRPVTCRPTTSAPTNPPSRSPREDQLAWKIAEVAADPVPVEPTSIEMIGNRIIDNAAVAAASLASNRAGRARGRRRWRIPCQPARRSSACRPIAASRPEWAAWANGIAVRELDFHDTFLAADYSHPGDNIPPILAVAQHCGQERRGARPRPRRPATKSRSIS